MKIVTQRFTEKTQSFTERKCFKKLQPTHHLALFREEVNSAFFVHFGDLDGCSFLFSAMGHPKEKSLTQLTLFTKNIPLGIVYW